MEASPSIVHIFTNLSGGKYYSARVEQILGYSPGFLVEHPFLWQESIHPDNRPAAMRELQKAEHGAPYDLEYRLRDAQGNWHWLLDRSIGCYQEGAEMVIEGLATDITRQKLTEQALEQANQTLIDQVVEIEDLQTRLREQAVRDPMSGLLTAATWKKPCGRSSHGRAANTARSAS